MRQFYEKFKVENMPILAPDQDMPFSTQDLDAEGSGRDELGYMHRIVLRQRVGKLELKYSTLNKQEFDYMNTLLRKPEFSLEIRKSNEIIKTRAYCSGVSAVLRDAVKEIYKDVSFSIVEC